MKRIIFVIFVMIIAIYSYALQILAEDFEPKITYTTTSGLSAVAPSTIENGAVNVIWQTQKGEGGARFTYNATKDGYVKIYINYDCAHTLGELYYRITNGTYTRDFTLTGHGNGVWGRYFEESIYLEVKQGDNVITISSLQESGGWNTYIKSISVSQVLDNVYTPVDNALYRDIYADTWVGADSLGRQMPTNEQVGNPNDRKVGMFYFLWHEGRSDDGTSSYGLFDNTAAYLSGGKGQGGVGALWAQMVKGALGYAHYWSEPYFGYYRSDDEWVIRKHAYQLSNMGVDFIYIDNTNGVFYMPTLRTVFETFRKIRAEGGKTPQICLFLGGDSEAMFYEQLLVIYKELYELDLYNDLWFKWNGKPLILGNKGLFDRQANLDLVKTLGWKTYANKDKDYTSIQYTTNVDNIKTRSQAKVAEIQSNKYMLDKFTVKRSWAFEGGTAYQATQGQDTWLWADTFPQAIGYNSNKTSNDQMVVMSGFWANGSGGRSNFSLNPTQEQKQTKVVSGKTVTIKEFTSTRPMVNDFEFSLVENGTSGQGLAYQEHWGRAIEINPKVAMVTGWNEWWAGRWDGVNNQIIANTYKVVTSDPIYKNYYVDCFNPEFSRDCEPMKNKDGLGYGDNYMYQTAMNIRRYKGVRPIPTATNQKAITINTNFTQWDDVGPEYRDTIGDITQRRGDISFGYMFNYENKSGRYDIEKAKVSIYNDKAYFYVKTVNNITSSTTDVGLMNLFIDSDQNPKTGWNGYDLLVNNNRTSISADVKKWNGTSWVKVESAPYKLSGNQMHLSMSASLLNQTGFDFKWCDNSVNSAKAGGGYYDDPMNFMDRGDAAPDDRYNYRYKPNSLGEKTFVENFDNLLSYPNWQGINTSFLKVDLFQQKLVTTEGHLEGIGTTKKYGEGNVISYKLKSWVGEDAGRHMSGFVCLRMPVLQRVWEGDNGVRIAVRANQIHITTGNVIYGDLDFITIDIPVDYSNEFKQVYLYDLGNQIVIFGENNVKFAEIEILANEIIVKDANNVEKGRRTVTLPSEGYVTIGSHMGKMEISQFTIGKVEKQQNKFSFSKDGLNLDKLETGTITAKSIQTSNTLICAQYSSLNKLKKILVVNPNQAKEANFDIVNGDYFKTMEWDFGNYKPISELETMSFIGKR